MVYIAPSLLAADFSALDREVAKIKQADMLHIDIMDGHFVPNISFGPGVVAALRDKTRLLFDVHLMLEHPMPYIAPFRKAGADVITFHVECKDDPEELIAAIEDPKCYVPRVITVPGEIQPGGSVRDLTLSEISEKE